MMELNSTQLNFYSVDDLPLIGKSSNLSRIARKQQQNLVLFNETEHSLVVEAVKRYPKRYLSADSLVRSYTLQHAKMGLPADYKKRNYCFRFRLETEQILVQFSCLDEMIHWANIISMGVNVSLDLETRSLPTDRSVPRRRRASRRSAWGRASSSRGGNRVRSYSDSEVIRRELSPPLVLGAMGMPLPRRASVSGSTGGIIGRIFGRKRASSNFGTVGNAKREKEARLVQHTTNDDDDDNDEEEDEEEEDDDDEGNDSNVTVDNNLNDDVNYNDDEIPDSEINSVHQLHEESDDDSINGENEYMQGLFNEGFSFGNNDESNDDSYEHIKWKPDAKSVSSRKLLKDAIRCLKILTNDETWVGKPIMAPARPPVFATCNGIKGSSDSSLRRRNKFIREFIVGTQGLVATVCSN